MSLHTNKLVVPKIGFVAKKDRLGLKLAVYGYEELWDAEGEQISQAFQELTGLTFWYKQITVHVVESSSSESGSRHKRMKLSARKSTVDDKRQILTHELAHRLLIGNYVDFFGKTGLFYAHLYAYLFLFDVWVKLYGKDFANKHMAKECLENLPVYKKTWDKALSLSFEQRQERLRRRIKLERAAEKRHLAKTASAQ